MANAAPLSDHSLKLSIMIKEASPFIIDKFKKEFGKLSGAIELVTKATKDFGSVMSKTIIPNVLVAFGTALATAGTEIIVLDDKLARMGRQFGLSNAEIKDFNKQLYSVGLSAGVLPDALAGVAQSLIEADFKGTAKDLVDLTPVVYKFSEVTGLSVAQTASFSAELSKVGIRSTELLKNIGTLRTSLQLSNKEFSAVVEITKQATLSMYAYGNSLREVSQRDMNKFGESVAKLAATMQALGVSTETTTKILKGMTDPVEWMNNPALMVSLGVNIQDVNDALSGTSKSMEDTEATLRKLRDGFGKFTSGGPMQLMAFSKAFGVPAADMQRFAKMTDEEISKQAKLANENKNLDEIWQNMGESITHLQRALARTFGSFFTIIKPAVVVLGQVLEKVAWLTEKITGLGSQFLDWVGWGKEFTEIWGGAVLLALTGLGVFLWRSATAFMANAKNALTFGTSLTEMSGSATKSAMSIEMLAASISQLGVQLGVATAKMEAFMVAQQGAAMAGGGIAGKTIATAAITPQVVPQIPTGPLSSNAVSAGAKWGGVFMRSAGAAMGGAMIAMQIGSSIQRKKFTVNDAAMILMSTAAFGGPAAPWMLGIGLALMVAGQIFPGFGNYDIAAGAKALFSGGKGMAANVSRKSSETASISTRTDDIMDLPKEQQKIMESKQLAYLEAIKNASTKTADSMGETNSDAWKRHRENKNISFTNRTEKIHDDYRTSGD